MDGFLDQSEKLLRESLMDLNVEFDQELRRLNKELDLVMTRHQNIIQAHQKDMLKLREACLSRGVDVNEVKLKYLSGHLDPGYLNYSLNNPSNLNMTLDTNYEGNNLLHYALPTTGRGGAEGFAGIKEISGAYPQLLGSKDASLFIDLDEDIRDFRERRVPDKRNEDPRSPSPGKGARLGSSPRTDRKSVV